ncbi:MAG: glucuronate isomerase [Kiritimatiellae bacterium]|nr:glucuronate isomerase [Kiritimatiellia bacterium]
MIGFDTLYSWVKDLPVVDWHNHLDMKMLAEDKPLGSLYEVWVKADPYKHRAMRICGEPERVITGDASEDEKWAAWTRTLPKLVGNPLFAWAGQELAFLRGTGNGERGTGGPRPSAVSACAPAVSSAAAKWWECVENVLLSEWTPSKILKAFNVEYLSPCVDAGELLTGFTRFTGLKELGAMPPGPDNSVNPVNPVQKTYKVVPSLRMNAGDEISVETLEKFDTAGCRVVDISVDDVSQLSTFSSQLSTVAAFAAAHGWTMLLHLGALRETSSRLRAAAGPAGGFAGMCAPVDPAAIAAFLNALEKMNALPRTILMTLNPEAHASLAVLAGSFNGAGLPGKVQLGPAWWWCDHEEGIRDVLEKNAAYGVLSTFIGMTTDSRSLLSFVRHDYFRRVLCKWVAEKVSSSAFPGDESLLRPLLENICYKNAKIFLTQRHKDTETQRRL